VSEAAPAPGPAAGEPPLAVDLDGTLIRSDLLWESAASAVARKPWLLAAIPFWLLAGRARFKERLAREGALDCALLPYRAEVVEWLRDQHAAGRRIVIATAAHESLAKGVSRHLGFVESVLATKEGRNLKGEAKREALVAAYGERGYDYLGDSAADLPAWRSARTAHGAGDASLLATARTEGRAGREFPRAPAGFPALARALRVHQWVKNLLVFVPVVTAHRVGDVHAMLEAAIAFACFCLTASAVYVVNDITDLESDRRHPAKRLRPFASGAIALAWAAPLVAVLLAAGAWLATLLPEAFRMALFAYLGATVLYSFSLKRVAVLDVLSLAALYTIRIFAGATAIGVPLSHWLLGFSMFLFLSLAFIKRYVELSDLVAAGGQAFPVAGRGYSTRDLPAVGVLGAVSGYLAVLVLALFITSADTLVHYRQPWALWGAPLLLLYWITRAWMLAHRRQMDHDPVAFALADPPSYAVLAAMLGVVWLAA
jgi:4-hydroxybenzoate polyprenyltransferase/phosphoserine phosphatase